MTDHTTATNQAAPLVGVSSWALHETLGAPPNFGVDAGATVPASGPLPDAALSLAQLPAFLAQKGFDTLQICHFHLPSRKPGYLSELKGAIQDAGLPLHALLIDEGDLTHPENGARDEAWIADWLAVAAQLGAQEVRIIAGKTVHEAAITQSAAALKRLAKRAKEQGVTVMTENWYALLSSPEAVRELLDRCEGDVRFLLDNGNWSGSTRQADLMEIAPYAHSCHAHVHFDGSRIDEAHLSQCLDLPFAPLFRGPFTLVNGGPDGIAASRDFIRSRFDTPSLTS